MYLKLIFALSINKKNFKKRTKYKLNELFLHHNVYKIMLGKKFLVISLKQLKKNFNMNN